MYFKKDSIPPAVQYGSQIIIQKPLQSITNSGNPGGFDYKQYCAFQDIHYQVYLQPTDYINTGQLHKNQFAALLINTRNHVLSILRKWVPGETESGVAEALLIGYREDLDKDLVRSYSNTRGSSYHCHQWITSWNDLWVDVIITKTFSQTKMDKMGQAFIDLTGVVGF